MPSVFRFFPSTRISDWATGAFGTPAAVPGAPDDLTATAGNTQVVLKWTAGAENFGTITGYKVEKNSGSWSDVTTDTSSTSTSYTVTGLTNGTAYTFRVSAINEIGTGAASSASSSTTPLTVPDAPTSLSVSAVAETPNASLSWSAPSGTGGSALTGYAIKRGGTVIVSDTGDTATSYVDGDTSENTSYTYTVAAVNAAGVGAYSSGDSATTNSVDVITKITASGGSTNTYSGYKSHKFTSSGTFTVSAGADKVEVCVVAGGGGGGSWHGPYNTNALSPSWNARCAGGGGGGVQVTSMYLSPGSYTVTVGAGGSVQTNGNISLVGGTPNSVAAIGGGAGGTNTSNAGNYPDTKQQGHPGGSGGGANLPSPNGPAGQSVVPTAGNPGGFGYPYLGPNPGGTWQPYNYPYSRDGGGGGGGAGGTGGGAYVVTSSSARGGNGGSGKSNNFETGNNQTYAGGGGGQIGYVAGDASLSSGGSGGGGQGCKVTGGNAGSGGAAGTANTGGGAGACSGPSATPGNGGSGIVILRYAT